MEIRNIECKTAIKEALSANTLEGLPNQLMEKITAVINVNPFHTRVINKVIQGGQTTTGSFSANLTSDGHDYYLYALSASFAKDAACDAATGFLNITFTQEGATKYLHRFAITTLTAQNANIYVSFPTPIKCDGNNTPVSFDGTFTVGLCSRAFVCYFCKVPKY